jgi:hypothetical protein
VIEYDGAYWHSAPAKVLVDARKSVDLLAAGHLVVRLREDALPSLYIADPRYRRSGCTRRRRARRWLWKRSGVGQANALRWKVDNLTAA